jgi:uncharacterized phiE125 gp8 family phage protein
VTMSLPTSKFVRSTAPTAAQEPVSPEEAKKACGLSVDTSYHDAAIVRYIALGRENVEHDRAVACYTGTYVRKMTCFPVGNWFELNIFPVTAIAITYVDSNGTTQTWSSTEYALDTSGMIPIVRLNDGYSWPVLRGDVNGITLTVTAGYATVAAVPATIKTAVLCEVVRQFRLENGEDAKGFDAAYEALAGRVGRGVYA